MLLPHYSMEIDTKKFDTLIDRIEESIEEAVDQLRDKIDETWRIKAAEEIHTSLDKYLDGLSIEKVGDTEIQISLSGVIPVSIETGTGSSNVQEGTLGSGIFKHIPISKASSKNKPQEFGKGKNIGEQVQQEVSDTLLKDVFDAAFSGRKNV